MFRFTRRDMLCLMRFRVRTLFGVITAASVVFGYWRCSVVSTEGRVTSTGRLVRIYHSTWKYSFFKPAAMLESIATGVHVSTGLMQGGEEYEWQATIEVPEE